MAGFGDRRQVADNFFPAIAEVIGAKYFAGGGCRKDRRRVACFLQTESFDTRLQAVGQAVRKISQVRPPSLLREMRAPAKWVLRQVPGASCAAVIKISFGSVGRNTKPSG